MLNKTAQTELYRLFLIEGLPEPLTPASSHLQFFDNYIEGTRLRIRSIRDPYANTWTRSLQQRFTVEDAGLTIGKLSEIHLNDPEYQALERFEGREIRKNRYFHEFDGRDVIFDVYLGPLWGLSTAKVMFEIRSELEEYQPPHFAVIDATADPFFLGSSLVDKRFADVQERLSAGQRPAAMS